MIVVLGLDGATDQLITGPDIVSRGFVYVKTSDELMDEAREVVTLAVEGCLDRGITVIYLLIKLRILFQPRKLHYICFIDIRCTDFFYKLFCLIVNILI